LKNSLVLVVVEQPCDAAAHDGGDRHF